MNDARRLELEGAMRILWCLPILLIALVYIIAGLVQIEIYGFKDILIGAISIAVYLFFNLGLIYLSKWSNIFNVPYLMFLLIYLYSSSFQGFEVAYGLEMKGNLSESRMVLYYTYALSSLQIVLIIIVAFSSIRDLFEKEPEIIQ